jgi:hypothetical protein
MEFALPTLTTEQCATYRARFAEVDAALHELRLGGATKRIRIEGKEVEYTAATLNSLQAYWNDLANLLAQCDGCYGNQRRMINIVPLI